MRGLKAEVEAMIGVVLASLAIAAPAAADCGAGAIQEATYVDGVWDGLAGSLVNATPSPEGLAWRVVEGATLETGVVVETFFEPGANIGSALRMVPADDKGIAPLFADVDQRVLFSGSVPCDAEPELEVHEDPIDAFDEPEPVSEEDAESAVEAPQQIAVAHQAPEPVTVEVPVYGRPWKGFRPI